MCFLNTNPMKNRHIHSAGEYTFLILGLCYDFVKSELNLQVARISLGDSIAHFRIPGANFGYNRVDVMLDTRQPMILSGLWGKIFPLLFSYTGT